MHWIRHSMKGKSLPSCDDQGELWLLSGSTALVLLFSSCGYAPMAMAQQQQLIQNGGFESGSLGWTLSGDFHIGALPCPRYPSLGYAYLAGAQGNWGNDLLGEMYQTFTVPASASSIAVEFYFSISTQETTTTTHDQLVVTLQDGNGMYLAEIARWTNNDGGPQSCVPYSHDGPVNLAAYAGRTLRLDFLGTTNATLPTVFRVDDVSVVATVPTGACCLNGVTCNTGVTQSACTGQGGIWQGAGSTNCANCLLPAPTLTIPTNGAMGVSNTPTFGWTPVTGANRYWLMASTNPLDLPTDPSATNCPGCVATGLSGNTDLTSYAVPVPFPYGGTTRTLSPGTTYYWQVQGYATNGAQGNYSAVWHFTTAASGCSYPDSYPYSAADPSAPDPYTLFYYRECTDYAAWKSNQAEGVTAPPYWFTDYMRGGHFGNAENWATNAAAIGFHVDTEPAVGAIAHWGVDELCPTCALGHVAYVEAVNPDGSVDISEYNRQGDHLFSTECAVHPRRFIHIAQCYANCDGSTTTPVLNVQDFTCFFQKFAIGDPYANCDGSTTTPILNVQDFTCFLQKFAQGCP